MRLSEAIMMGRHLVDTPTYCGENEENGGGCALTMAVVATGANADWTSALAIWPWLKDKHLKITRRFDCEVMTGKMTLEQLVDYVRSIEPAEIPEQPEYQSDWRDEAGITDASAESERYKP